jgi:ABC-type transport system involved in cytochrome c biogenesis permease subunit
MYYALAAQQAMLHAAPGVEFDLDSTSTRLKVVAGLLVTLLFTYIGASTAYENYKRGNTSGAAKALLVVVIAAAIMAIGVSITTIVAFGSDAWGIINGLLGK